MNRFKLSPLVIAMMALGANANAEAPADQNENIEKVTVYGHHNRLILESGTATKSSMSLMETPAAVVVVDAQLIEDQGLNTLQDAIRNISGLTQDGNNYGIGDNLAIRGLGVNYTYDGIYAGADLGNSYNPTRSLTNVESIEVLKGPATGLYGMGEAGGVINLIEKKPQFEERYEIKTSIGQWDSYSLMIDATNALTENTAYRIVANHESSDGYRGLSSERSELYASLRYDVSDNNRFTLSAAYIDDEVQIDSVGHPLRLVDYDTLGLNPSDTVTASDLVNGDPASGGLQLTNAQIEQLAGTLSSSDGIQPINLGDTALISPLSTPNQGEEFRIKLRHDIEFGNNWSFTHQLQYRTYDTDYTRQTSAYNYVYYTNGSTVNLAPRAPLVLDGELYPYAARRQEYRNITADETAIQYFADLTKTWSWGSIQGEHLFSANYEDRDTSYQQLSIWDADDSRTDTPVPYILDIRNPNWPTGSFEDYLSDNSLRSKYDKSVSAWGVSFQEVLYLNDALTARIGGAYGGVKQTYQNQRSLGNPELDADDSGFTYNLGLSYRVSEQFATFVNHSKGRTAYSVLGSLVDDTSGAQNRPDSESESWDLGARFTAFDEQLLGSIVWFNTARTNLRYTNPEYDEADNPNVTQYFFDEADRTKGVEFDLNFDINEQWSMNVNATYQDPVTEPGAQATSQADEQTKGIAEKLASAWLSYSHQFEGLVAPVRFSLGVNYEDERSIAVASFDAPYAYINSYSVWDAAVSYKTDEWNVQLNVRNLGDKDYYSKAMFLGGLPGNERNVELTFDYNF